MMSKDRWWNTGCLSCLHIKRNGKAECVLTDGCYFVRDEAASEERRIRSKINE
jgi:hypothetical protein